MDGWISLFTIDTITSRKLAAGFVREYPAVDKLFSVLAPRYRWPCDHFFDFPMVSLFPAPVSFVPLACLLSSTLSFPLASCGGYSTALFALFSVPFRLNQSTHQPIHRSILVPTVILLVSLLIRLVLLSVGWAAESAREATLA